LHTCPAAEVFSQQSAHSCQALPAHTLGNGVQVIKAWKNTCYASTFLASALAEADDKVKGAD